MGKVDVTLESDVVECGGLVVRRLRGREAIGESFVFEINVIETGDEVPSFDDFDRAPITINFEVPNEPVHRIHGVVVGFTRLDPGAELAKAYRLIVAPAFWLTKMVESLDLYVHTSVVDVITDKLAAFDLTERNGVFLRLGEYPTRELVVQYKETDHDFISRLCEHEGISLFFEHGDEQSVLVLADGQSGFQPAAVHESIAYASADSPSLEDIDVAYETIPKTFICRDYDYRTPRIIEESHELEEEASHGGTVIDYGANPIAHGPGNVPRVTSATQRRYATVRAEERLARRQVFRGTGNRPHLTPGSVVEIEGHPFIDDKLLIIEVEHALEQPAGSGDGKFGYHNRFTAVLAKNTYRPPRRTPKPRIMGVVPGVVEIPLGEVERFARLDDEGRYHVRLMFGNEPVRQESYSQRIRQIQMSAGPGYGAHFPLKPGVEVAVAFVDGDPDRPMIVGAVPNPTTESPVTADNATHSRLKTESGILIELGDTL